ncbi:MAG: hypothetical protein BV458_02535 [Thermoplasmata archaeon M9B2D]|nr:MAG: hypothetical protein BV458_02535 [Thermoplasmata archaeon M9B2D]
MKKNKEIKRKEREGNWFSLDFQLPDAVSHNHTGHHDAIEGTWYNHFLQAVPETGYALTKSLCDIVDKDTFEFNQCSTIYFVTGIMVNTSMHIKMPKIFFVFILYSPTTNITT